MRDDDQSKSDDRWLDWLLRGRDARRDEVRRQSLSFLQPIYERVLAGADLHQGDVLLESGAGEGHLGLLALQAAGPTSRLLLTDHSAAVVDHLVRELHPELADRVSFLQTPVESLAGVEDQSVDVVLVRSVLIYSADLAAAVHSIARVLRPGGRLSLFEPLWTYFDLEPQPGEFFGRNLHEVAEEVQIVRDGYRTVGAATGAGSVVTASSLVATAEAAGFRSIRATTEAESLPLQPADDTAVDQALHGRPNPNAPSVTELAANLLLPTDRAHRFLAAFENAVRAGRGRTRTAAVYLTANH